jgi:hypothetical protein
MESSDIPSEHSKASMKIGSKMNAIPLFGFLLAPA